MSKVHTSWGFIGDLRKCVGKKIERVEIASLGFGYTINNAWVILFTDGSRAFVAERPTEQTVIMPDEKWMKTSEIFKPEELADMVADRMRITQEDKKRKAEQEKRQLAELQKKYGSAVMID